MGPWTARTDTPFGIVWHTDSIKCLGVWIGSSSNVCARNCRDATDKFDCVLQRWSGRALSFAGRSNVVKSSAAAKLWHVAHVVPPPPGVVADIVRKTWSFIWHNMRTLVRRPVWTLPTTACRLGAIDFDLKVASLHIQWMRRLPLDDPSPLCTVMVRQSGLTVWRVGGDCERPECASISYTYFLRYYRETVLSFSMRCVLSFIVSRRSRCSALVGESGDC